MFRYYFKLRWKVQLKGRLVLNKSADGWKMACDPGKRRQLEAGFSCVRGTKKLPTLNIFSLRIQKLCCRVRSHSKAFFECERAIFLSFFRQHSHHTQDVSAEVEHAIAVLVSSFFYHTHGAFWGVLKTMTLCNTVTWHKLSTSFQNLNNSDLAHLLEKV